MSLQLDQEVQLERTRMSAVEVRRAGVLARVQLGELTQVEAAAVLGLSYR